VSKNQPGDQPLPDTDPPLYPLSEEPADMTRNKDSAKGTTGKDAERGKK
jgi:hypothetical protein